MERRAKNTPKKRNSEFNHRAPGNPARSQASTIVPLGLRIRTLDLDRHQLRLLFAQTAQQIARGGDSDQSQHDGHADHQMRIHEFLVLEFLRLLRLLRLLRFLRFAERQLIERVRLKAAAYEPHVSKSIARQK
ncbi:hypothetical protein PQR53_08645 [Paraburkholderia fungorum]|uniref:hypothetical protein n=1 Tax=Paraburkholderia fungorum TaxID=134537 RepID=UPI0038B9C808